MRHASHANAVDDAASQDLRGLISCFGIMMGEHPGNIKSGGSRETGARVVNPRLIPLYKFFLLHTVSRILVVTG